MKIDTQANVDDYGQEIPPVEWLVFEVLRDVHQLHQQEPDHWIVTAVHSALIDRPSILEQLQGRKPVQGRLFQ